MRGDVETRMGLREGEIEEDKDPVVWGHDQVNEVECHVGETDHLLRSAADVACYGAHKIRELSPEEPVDSIAVQERLEQIVELIESYRTANSNFIEQIYGKRKAGEEA